MTTAVTLPGEASVAERAKISRRLNHRARYVAADNGHRNCYDNELSPPELADRIVTVSNAPPGLEPALREPPRPVTIREQDVGRIRTLTGRQTLSVDVTSPAGFSNTHQP